MIPLQITHILHYVLSKELRFSWFIFTTWFIFMKLGSEYEHLITYIAWIFYTKSTTLNWHNLHHTSTSRPRVTIITWQTPLTFGPTHAWPTLTLSCNWVATFDLWPDWVTDALRTACYYVTKASLNTKVKNKQ